MMHSEPLTDQALFMLKNIDIHNIVPRVNQTDLSSAAWADVATILPWNLYEFYADRDILHQQFDSMCAWGDYIKLMNPVN